MGKKPKAIHPIESILLCHLMLFITTFFSIKILGFLTRTVFREKRFGYRKIIIFFRYFKDSKFINFIVSLPHYLKI